MALINIWKEASADRTLVLIGSGPEQKLYEETIRRDGIKNVLIKPYVPHEKLLDYFKVAEASILLTKEDIYGHVVNESLSQGCPVIGSNKANSSINLIKNGENGYLIDVTNKEEILSVINAEITAEMRENAIKTAQNNTIEIMAKCHLNVFQEYMKI